MKGIYNQWGDTTKKCSGEDIPIGRIAKSGDGWTLLKVAKDQILALLPDGDVKLYAPGSFTDLRPLMPVGTSITITT